MSDADSCYIGIHDNDENSVMRSVSIVKPTDRFLVQEVSGHRPGYLRKVLSLLKPHIGIVTAVGQDHYRTFRSLEKTAQEKGTMVELLPINGVAILNADDPHVAAMVSRTKARVITYGTVEGADVRATDIHADWPERLSMTVTYGGESVRIETDLFSDLLTSPLLAAIAGALAVGVSLKQCAESLKGVETFPRRMSIHPSPQGIWFINDAGKAPYWSVLKAIALFANVSAPRTTMIFGTFSDVPGVDSSKYRQVARDALEIADRVLFVGPNAKYIRKRMTPENEGRLLVMDSLADTIRCLGQDAVPDEVVYIKSGNREHLERLIYGRSFELNCWKTKCAKVMSCHQCEESGMISCE